MSSYFQISFNLSEKLSKCLPLDFLAPRVDAHVFWSGLINTEK